MEQNKTKKRKYGISALEVLIQLFSSLLASIITVIIILTSKGLL